MSTALAKIPLRQVADVRSLLQNEQARDQLAAVAARHMNPERLMRITANAIRTTPKLQQCDPLSFLGALMQCASLGLEPNTILGHAYLVPFDNRKKGITEVQLIVGYKGLIDLARRSGHITSISANIHYSDDDLWDWEEGTESRLRHRPGQRQGSKLHAYAIAKFKDGGHAYVVLPWAHVLKIRDGSQGWQTAVRFGKTDSAPWKTHEDAMAMKTAIRALAKFLPLSVDFVDAMRYDADENHVDFAAYAMNPDAGPVIDGTTDVPDDAGGDPLAVEAQKSVPDASTKQRAAEKVESKPEQKAAPAAKAGTGPIDYQAIFDRIVTDMLTGMPVEAAKADHAEGIAILERDAPMLHHKLIEEMEAAA